MLCRQLTCEGLTYYEAIEMIVSANGSYTIISNSGLHICRYIYTNSFIRVSWNQNLLKSDNYECNDENFAIDLKSQSMTRFILLITNHMN